MSKKIITKKYYIMLLQLNNQKEAVSRSVVKYHTDLEEGHAEFVKHVLACNELETTDYHVLSLKSEYVSEVDVESLFTFGSVTEYEITPHQLDELRKVFAAEGITFKTFETNTALESEAVDNPACVNSREVFSDV